MTSIQNSGKVRISHLFQQVSPYAHLVSGGKASVVRMFVNNSTGQRGLVCQYDAVCFDEVSGISFDQKDGVNIIAPPRAIQVARNALAAYEPMAGWNPHREQDMLAAHRVLMMGVIDKAASA